MTVKIASAGSLNGNDTNVTIQGAGPGGHTATIRFLKPDMGPYLVAFDGDNYEEAFAGIYESYIVTVDGGAEHRGDCDDHPDVTPPPADPDRGYPPQEPTGNEQWAEPVVDPLSDVDSSEDASNTDSPNGDAPDPDEQVVVDGINDGDKGADTEAGEEPNAADRLADQANELAKVIVPDPKAQAASGNKAQAGGSGAEGAPQSPSGE